MSNHQPQDKIEYSFKQKMLLALAEKLGPLLIRSLGRLCKYQVRGQEHFDNAKSDRKGLILALWHGRMLLPIYHLRNRRVVSLVSLHFDGEIITRIVERLGITIKRGSPREGGMEGFKAMLRELKDENIISIFPDGPTGPRHSVRDGVLHLARLTGAPIVPMLYSAYPCWRVRSWDKHMIMKPFSRGIIQFGEPIYLPRKISKGQEFDRFRDMIRNSMVKIEQDLDAQLQVREPSER